MANRRINVHGHSGRDEQSSEYNAWRAMKRRCNNSDDSSYHNYGGRGIEVCAEWQDEFMAFYRDMGDKPTSGHTLERIDNDKGYSPFNCRWATRKAQANNRRTNKWIAVEEIDYTQKQLANQLGIDPHTLSWRMKNWPMSRVLGIDQAYEELAQTLR